MFKLRHLTDANFQSTVVDADHPVLVDFWAAWCGPCRMMAPEIEKLAAQFGDRLEVTKMDTEAEPAAAGSLGIMSIPTLVLFSPGAQPRALVGYRTAEQVADLLGLATLPVVAAA
jgi:thioredoxin 1